MKTIILILTFLSGHLFLYAQNSDHILDDPYASHETVLKGSCYFLNNYDLHSSVAGPFIVHSTMEDTIIRYLYKDGEWLKDFRLCCRYNGSSLPVEEISSYWKGVKWMDIDRVQWTYDPSGNLIECISQTTQTSMPGYWLNSTKYQYGYNENNKLINACRFFWNGEWEMNCQNKYEHTYADDLRVHTHTYHWDECGWNCCMSTYFTYDENNRLICEIKNRVCMGNEMCYRMYTYDYDLENRLIKDEKHLWSMGTWQKKEKNEYFFNSWNMLTSRIISYGRNDQWNPFMKRQYDYIGDKITQHSEELWNNDGWVPFANYVYSTNPTFDIPETNMEMQLIKVFPNPFTHNVTFGINIFQSVEDIELYLYDVNGRLVAYIPVDGFMAGQKDINYDGSALDAGSYYYRIGTPGKAITGKIYKIN